MTDKIKLALVITGLTTGGAETMLLRLLQRLDRRRFSPSVISLTTMGDIGEHIAAMDIPVEALGINKGLGDIAAFSRLILHLRRMQPDVVHTWLYHADLLGGIAARLAGVRAVAWGLHYTNLSPELNKASTLKVVSLCARISNWAPARIVSCSESAMRTHAALGYAEEKFVVIPNGFDLTRFRIDPAARSDIRNELGIDAPLVALVGRYHPQKNHAGFIRAAGLLHRRRPDVHFLLIGNGVDGTNQAIVDQLTEAGIRNVTHLLGLRHDVPRLMAAVDVVASSSDGEAFPNVIGEAMACGALCAVTAVGDSAFIVGDTGRVVQPGDMEALATAMEELLTMPADARQALRVRARSRIETMFDIDKVTRQYEELYGDMVRTTRLCAV